MARCYICDVELTEVAFDSEYGIMPCGECLEAVDEALEEFEESDENGRNT